MWLQIGDSVPYIYSFRKIALFPYFEKSGFIYYFLSLQERFMCVEGIDLLFQFGNT